MAEKSKLPDGTLLPDGYEFIDGEIYTPDPDGRVLTIAEYKNGYIIPANTNNMVNEFINENKEILNLRSQIESIFFKEFEPAQSGKLRFLRGKRIDFEDDEETFWARFDKLKDSNPMLTVEAFKKTEKGTISDLFEKLEKYKESPFFNREDQYVIRAIVYLDFVEKYDPNKSGELSHRLRAIIYDYKVKAGYEKPLTRKEKMAQGNKNYEKAFDSINEVSKTYRPIKQEEIIEILPYLKDYPKAAKLANCDLIKLS